MAVQAAQIPVPSNGSAAVVIQSTPNNASSISIRNTGAVTVLLGPAGNEIFPLAANEFLGLEVAPDDILLAVVQTPGTAGQVTILGVG